MLIYRLHEVPTQPTDTVFRTKGAGTLLILFTALLLGGWSLVLSLLFHPAECLASCIVIPIVALLTFIWVAILGNYRKSREPSNWLLRFDGHRLLIKFRSYLNSHFSQDDPQAF